MNCGRFSDPQRVRAVYTLGHLARAPSHVSTRNGASLLGSWHHQVAATLLRGGVLLGYGTLWSATTM